MRKLLLVLVTALALALSSPALAAQGKGQGKGGGKGKSDTAGASAEKGKDKEKDKDKDKEKEAKAKKEKEDKEREEQAAQGRAFGKKHEKKIRDWFGNNKNLQGLPPGLAKREQLPPGLQKHLEKNGTLPPGLQKRIQPLPESLDKQLPKPAPGTKRVVVAGNVILLEERSSKVIDIVKDVFGSGKSGSSTGVRRTD